MPKRVVITSAGIVSPLGNATGDILHNLRNDNISFVRPSFDREVVTCPVKNFNLKEFTGRFKYSRYLNRGSQLGLAAAIQAVKNSGIDPADISEAGIFSGTGPNLDISAEFPEINNGNPDIADLPALWILKFLPNTLNSVIAQICGIHGDNLTINTACAASLQAIGEAYRKIKDGYLNVALAGGGDSRINKGGILSYKKAHALYSGDLQADRASRPFDKNRHGFVPGEGGAFFILEELKHAEKREAEIIAEVCGFGASIDGYNMTAPRPEGIQAEKAIRTALAEAGVMPDNIGLISSHGTGTPLNDDAEADIIERIFKDKKPHVTAIKSWIGHCAAACGALELAVCLICMRNNFIPGIRNLDEPCNKNLNFVRKHENIIFDNVLLENFGFGGQNSALIIKSYNK